ncbi:hypothetical protein LR48_Vigan107s002500 [Vigna angularis]|uniref:Uncharacterized protein n=1 Tax=Phaseolus angularis TaxID=3914 RepID=A0A0L9T599_PHAAN|nr:hypothetical protein LR48_Vigan107s002500 [Vigna angularis]
MSMAKWRRNMQEMRQETRELLRVLGGRTWNQEKGLKGNPGSVNKDQDSVNRGKLGTSEQKMSRAEPKMSMAEWGRNMQEMQQETRELLRVLGGRMWNQEKGLKGSPGSVNGDQDFVNRGKIGRREEFLQDVLKGKKEGKISMEARQDSLLDIKKAKKPSDGGENSNNWEKERETDISAKNRELEGKIGEKKVHVKGKAKTKTVMETLLVLLPKKWKKLLFLGEIVGVGGGVQVKTMKEGEDRGKKAEYGGNMVTIMAGNKVEDAVVLSREKFIQEFKIWLSQTCKTPEDQWQGYFFAGLQYNIQRKQFAQHDDDEEIGWSDQQVLSFLASRMNKSGQGEGLASATTIRIKKRFWGWKKRKEFLIIHQKIVKIQAHRGEMIGYRVIGYNGFRIEGRGNERAVRRE